MDYTKTMVKLFGKNIKTISKHLTNIFESEELVKSEVTFNPNDSTIRTIPPIVESLF